MAKPKTEETFVRPSDGSIFNGWDSVEAELLEIFNTAADARDQAQKVMNRVSDMMQKITRTRVVELSREK